MVLSSQRFPRLSMIAAFKVGLTARPFARCQDQSNTKLCRSQ
ncbi:hypothetical protein [Marinisporobacter balticus]|nr:hypothetical protein [Marinisporobacter balticus]